VASASYNTAAPDAWPIGPGRVVLVVGSSGAGKDAILHKVRMLLATDGRFVFPRRIVTRAPSTAEDNQAVSADEFEFLVRQGALALTWNAHGLRYGLPLDVDDAVRRGCTVVFNASRQIVTAARSRYFCAVVYIDAPVSVRWLLKSAGRCMEPRAD
jgi:ribose 1,5-bisphosphokinase